LRGYTTGGFSRMLQLHGFRDVKKQLNWSGFVSEALSRVSGQIVLKEKLTKSNTDVKPGLETSFSRWVAGFQIVVRG
jgi:hypothetical protein